MGLGLMPDPAVVEMVRLAVDTTIIVEAFEHFVTPHVCKIELGEVVEHQATRPSPTG